MKRKLLIMLALAALLAALCCGAARADVTGTCGDNITWTLTDSGRLTLTGTGAIPDYNIRTNPSPFKNNTAIKTVSIGEGITRVGNTTFHGLTGLTSVTLPTSLETIGTEAFDYCSGLTHITLRSHLTTIGRYAFGSTGLTDVMIPANVEEIGEYAFRGCSSMSYALVMNPNASFGPGVFDGVPTGFKLRGLPGSTAQTYAAATGVSFAGPNCGDNVTFTISAGGVVTISGSGPMYNYVYCYDSPLFNNKDITQVIIQEGVTTVGDNLLYQCDQVESVTLPSSLTAIGEEAFRTCSALTSIDLPENLESIGMGAFTYCNHLLGVAIPEGVINLPFNAFVGCTRLEQVSLPSTLESIGFQAFADCVYLTELDLPSSVSSIEAYAFDADINLTSLTIRNPQANIAADALRDCTGGVTIHGWTGSTAQAFANANGFGFASIGENAGTCGDNVTYAFDPSTGTLTVSGQGGMTPWNFSGEVYAPWYGFAQDIRRVVIENGVTNISSSAFYACVNLTDVSISDTVDYVGAASFYGCTSLREVVIPAHVGLILYNSFHDCANLRTVSVLNPECEFRDEYLNAFGGCPNLEICGWADSTAETYAATAGIPFNPWNTSGQCGDNVNWTIDAATGELTLTGQGGTWDYNWVSNPSPFSWTDSVSSVTVGEGITYLGTDLFHTSRRLASATLPDSLTELGEKAFYHTALTDITLPERINIGEWAFCYCESLSSANILNVSAAIGDKAFSNCAANLTIWSYDNSTAQAYALANGIHFESLGARSGSCGFDVTWTFNGATGTLTISGTGPMWDYDFNRCPWYGFSGDITNVVIESGVTRVGREAFRLCGNLTSASLPDTLTVISYLAFQDTGLTSITIPSSVHTIMEQAFYCCTCLTSVNIPGSVHSIGPRAFNLCTGLTSATINNRDADIKIDAFAGCPSLTLHGWPRSTAEDYAYVAGIPFVSLLPDDVLILPDDLTVIESEAFLGVNASSVFIPAGVTVIEGDPFAGSHVVYVYGYAGTAAETFANNNGYFFVTMSE